MLFFFSICLILYIASAIYNVYMSAYCNLTGVLEGTGHRNFGIERNQNLMGSERHLEGTTLD